MKTKICSILVSLFLSFFTFSQTNIPGGNVSGIWTKANSPYIIDGYITIQNTDLLSIEPGVEIIFSDPNYGLTIEGRILAEGTYHDSINFTSSSIEWRRIKFLNTNSNGQDSSKLIYCIIEKGLTYEDSYQHGGGIYCENSDKLLINHCLIHDNNAIPGNGGGIGLYWSSPLIINSKICDNNTLSTNTYGGGIWCSASNPTLKNLLIISNEVGEENVYGGGIAIIGSEPIIENITVYGNTLDGTLLTRGGGIYYVHNSGGIMSISNSIIRNNTSDEIYVEDGTVNVSYSNIGGGFSGTGNIDADPLFYNVSEDDFRLTWDNWPTVDATKSPCIDSGDPASPLNLDGTQADMGAYYWHHGTHVSVGGIGAYGTWPLSGSPYVLDSLVFIGGGSELIIEPGVEVLFPLPYSFNVYGRLYADGDEINQIYFLSIYPEAGWPGIRFVNTEVNPFSESLLDHCIISGGKSIGPDPDDNYGGAIYCENSSDVWIFNCEIENNYAAEKGGGIYCLNSDILLSNNLIQDNISGNEGGGIYCENSDINASNIYVRDNVAENGGGLYLKSSNPIIEHSSITGNNAPSGGGLIIDNCSGNYNYLTIVKNTASWGGGMACITSGNPAIKNTTISENTASTLGGSIYSLNSNPVLTNSIVWNNYGPQEIFLGSGGNVTSTYSAIEQPKNIVWPGTGNINADPQFIDPASWDFHFSWIAYPDPETKSPCIDTGDPSSTNDPDGTRADMGAYPYEQTYTTVPGGDLSGTLACAGSPYNVFGDITIPSGEELIIEPCVYVIFQGDYKLTVNGRLLAEGTAEDEITFYPADKSIGWQGIRFNNLNSNGQDSSRLVHCQILDGNADGSWIYDQGGGVYVSQSSKLLIDHCYFYGNRATTFGGAMYLTQSSPIVSNSIFINNTAQNGGAIRCYDNVNATLLNCYFANNVAENGGAVEVSSCAPTFSGSTMVNNHATKFGGAIYHDASQSPTFDDINRCNIYDNYANYAGLDFYTGAGFSSPPVLNINLDTATVTLMNEHFAYPFYLFNISSSCARFIQEDSDMYVSTSGSDLNSGTSASDPIKTIKMALIKIIADSINPKTIHLADGIYSAEVNGEIFPINHRSHVTISGESRANTRIYGDSLNRLMVSYGDDNDSITGLTFDKGYFNGDGGAVVIENNSNPVFNNVSFQNNYSTYNGGAIRCYDDCNPVFSYVSFINNSSNNGGGAMYCQSIKTIIMDSVLFDSNSSRYSGGGIQVDYTDECRLYRCNFNNNSLLNGAGGGATLRHVLVNADSLTFAGNSAIGDGGAIWGYGATLNIRNSNFNSNSASGTGGAIGFYNGVNINMENVVFNWNTSIEGGAIRGFSGSTVDISNGLFLNNNTLYDPYSNGDGGAMSLNDVATTLTNVTLSGNTADGDGGGLYFWSSSGTINYTVQNSIIHGNTPDQIFVDYSALVSVDYSDIEGGWLSGTGNINQNPLFSDPGSSDYGLGSTSPCINAGNPDTTGLSLPNFDLGGDPRISLDTIDMGAYEFFSGIELDLKAFLEGPYNGTNMNTNLTGHLDPENSGEGLPIQQPYNIPPWNYTGTEDLSSIPFTDIVDWVLIEVRDTTDISLASPESIAGRQAVLLLDDGSLVDINRNNIKFGNPIDHQCYITLSHRNHLDVISAFPLTASGGIYSYDFTSPVGQAFGTDAQKNLGGGLYGMYGGDGNADGIINELDKSLWEIMAGKGGYLQEDLQLDGHVNNQDKNDIWFGNNGQNSQVPD